MNKCKIIIYVENTTFVFAFQFEYPFTAENEEIFTFSSVSHKTLHFVINQRI